MSAKKKNQVANKKIVMTCEAAMILILETGMNDIEKGCGGLVATPWASSSSNFCTIFQVFFGIKGPLFSTKKYHNFS